MGRDGKAKIRRKGRLGSLGQDRAITASIVLCVFAAVMAAAGGYLTETGSEESVPVIVDIIEETSAAKAQTTARGGVKEGIEIIDDAAEAVTSVIDGSGKADSETAASETLADVVAADIAAETESSGSEGLININTATAKELESLYGIGEKLAAAIIEYREEQPFERPEDIMKVKGIGTGKFDKIKDRITC
ncbi:MAG: ComEA family DNA-binding protein [Oscillospiraceae bacterium]|nr:ComEA family DNA-binding protein [Oscillospiraceae bacterium]